MVENYLMYVKNVENNVSNKFDVSVFDNEKVVLLKESKFPKEKRKHLQKEIDIRPYYLNQSILKKFLKFIFNESNRGLNVIDIIFSSDEVKDSVLFDELNEAILNRIKKKEIYNLITTLIEDYEVDIDLLKISYYGEIIELSKNGVLSVWNSERILKLILSDEIFNNLILGILRFGDILDEGR